MYNKYISLEKAHEYNKLIDDDPTIPADLKKSPLIREVCMAGLYLAEELFKLECPESLIIRIQYSAGKMSFGKEPWEIHLKFLEGYKNNTLDFEQDSNNLN